MRNIRKLCVVAAAAIVVCLGILIVRRGIKPTEGSLSAPPNVLATASRFKDERTATSRAVQQLLPDDYKGVIIQIDLVDESDRPLPQKSIYVGPVTDRESAGSWLTLDGASSVRLGYVDDRPAKLRELRAGILYFAEIETTAGGKAVFQRNEFTVPELDTKSSPYRVKLAFSTHPASTVKAEVKVESLPFQLEGVAPDSGPLGEDLCVLYCRNGRAVYKSVGIAKKSSFKLDVDSLGGDLVFTDIDMRVVYGLKLAVASPKIGRVEAIRGHRKYRYFRTLKGGAEIAEFFPMDQARVPLSCAVVPPGRQDADFAAVPGKYRVRICSEENFESRAEMPFIEFTLADQPDVRLR